MHKIVEVQSGVVTQVSTWDGSPFENPPNRTIVLVALNHAVQPGWLWHSATNSFAPTSPLAGPRKIEKIDFMRLFTMEERVRYNALRKVIKDLSVEDYMSSSPVIQLYIALDIVFDSFDLAALVELDHPETVQGLGLLAMGGIFGEDQIVQQTRIQQVLAAQMPVV